MKPLDMAFELVRKFAPMKPEDYAQLRNEAEEWDSKILSTDENKIKSMYAIWTRKWGVRLFCAIFYIVLLRKIPMWINPEIYEAEEKLD